MKIKHILVSFIVLLVLIIGGYLAWESQLSEKQKLQRKIMAEWGNKNPKVMVPEQVTVAAPDVTIVIQDYALKEFVKQFIGEAGITISLSELGVSGLDKGSVSLLGLNDLKFQSEGTFYLAVKGRANVERIFDVTVTLNEIGINIYPFIIQDKDQEGNQRYYLRFFSVVSYLDFNDVPPRLEKALANMVNQKFNNDFAATKYQYDVDDLCKIDFQNPFNDKRHVNLLTKASVSVEEGRLVIVGKR